DRDPLAAHVPQAQQVFRAVGDLEGLLVVQDLPDHAYRHCEDLVAQTEGDVLGFVVGHQADSLKSASCSSGPPMAMSSAKPLARSCCACTECPAFAGFFAAGFFPVGAIWAIAFFGAAAGFAMVAARFVPATSVRKKAI